MIASTKRKDRYKTYCENITSTIPVPVRHNAAYDFSGLSLVSCTSIDGYTAVEHCGCSIRSYANRLASYGGRVVIGWRHTVVAASLGGGANQWCGKHKFVIARVVKIVGASMRSCIFQELSLMSSFRGHRDIIDLAVDIFFAGYIHPFEIVVIFRCGEFRPMRYSCCHVRNFKERYTGMD